MILSTHTYNPSLGRFLSVDPLFEAFPNQSSYSYSFNNPISYKDPSGLAPEKEKGGGMKLQGQKTIDEILMAAMAQQQREAWANEWKSITSSFLVLLKKAMDNADYMVNHIYEINFGSSGGNTDGGGGGGSAGEGSDGRLGKTESGNGANPGVYGKSEKAKDDIRRSVEDDYEQFINFDENGKVIFCDDNKDAIDYIIHADPESNFTKLYAMATNTHERFDVYSIGRDEEFGWYPYHFNTSLTHFGTLDKPNKAEPSSYWFDQAVGGEFIGSRKVDKYKLSLGFLNNISDIYVSNVNWKSKVFGREFSTFEITAHELYFHGYGMFIGRRKKHGSEYKDIEKEIFNSSKKRP